MSNSTEVITGCDPDFEYCPLERSQNSTSGNSFEMEDHDSRTTLLWLLILYYVQTGIVPLLAGTMWFRDFKVYDKWWSTSLMWLHALSYLPTSIIGTMYYAFGDNESSFTHLLDDTFVWLMVYLSPNAGLVTHSIGWTVFFLSGLFSSESGSYWVLFFLYLFAAAYMHFF